jgi:hypothetical protein
MVAGFFLLFNNVSSAFEETATCIEGATPTDCPTAP